MKGKPERDIILRWLSKGDHDVAAASLLLRKTALHDITCYHCGQAAERYFKALLTYHGIQAPRTHDIEHLNSLLPPGRRVGVPPEDLAYLSPLGIDPWWEPVREQAERAVAIAGRLKEEIRAGLPPEFR